MKYKTLVFDWDGTLIDSVDRIVHCLQETIRKLNYETKTNDEAKSIIGLGLEEAIFTLMPEVKQQPEKLAITVDTYRQFFFSGTIPSSPLFKGTLETLGYLKNKGYEMTIATGKSYKGLIHELKSNQLMPYFSVLKTADLSKSKPDPLMLNQIIDELGCDKNTVVMIGDTTFDLEMAKNAGVASIGLTCGVHSEQQLKAFNPIKIIKDIHYLMDVL